MKQVNLLVLTTAGQLRFLREAIASSRDPLDVLVVDDATPLKVGIANFCAHKGLKFLTKPKAKGLTDSWNMAYQYFRENKYANCIISNDDVRFARGFSGRLFSGLLKFDLIGPLSNDPGDGARQRIMRYVPVSPTPDNFDSMQDALSPFHGHRFMQIHYINGFCFAFCRRIAKFQFSDEYLINPIRINVKNESDLIGRITHRGGRIGICKIAYVFHWKQATYKWLGRRALKCRDTVWTHWSSPSKPHHPKPVHHLHHPKPVHRHHHH